MPLARQHDSETATRHRQYIVPALVATGYLVTALVVDPLIAVAVSPVLSVATAFVFAAALALGTSVAWGAGAGVVLATLVTGPRGAFVGVAYLAVVLFALTATALAYTFDAPPHGSLTLRDGVRYLGVALGSVSAYSAVLAWGADTLGVDPFSIVVTRAVVRTTVSVVIIAPILLVLLVWLLDGRWVQDDSETARVASWPVLGTILVPVAWVGTGYVVSVVFQAIQLEYRQILVNKLGTTAVTLVQGTGPRGRWALALFGFVAFVAYLVSLVALWRRYAPETEYRG